MRKLLLTVHRSRSLLLFVLMPGLSVIAPIMVYPAVTGRYGSVGFVAIAVGQSVGAAIATTCELGWSVVGPQTVARLSADSLSEYHRNAMASKVVALAAGLPIAVVIGYFVPLDFKWVGAATAASLSLSCLSPAWLLTGLNRPGLILLSDSVPRVLLNLAAALAIGFGAPLVVFAGVNALAVPIALFLASRVAGFGVIPRWEHFMGAPAAIRAHVPLTMGRAVSVLYTSLMTTLVGVMAPSAVAVFAATDRMLRMGLSVLAGVPSRMQSWLGHAQGPLLAKRVRWSIASNVLLGLGAAGVFASLAGPVGGLLFGGSVIVPMSSIWLGSGIAIAVCTSRGLGLSLVATGNPNAIAAANLIAAGIAVVSAVLLVPLLGADGGLLAVLGAELFGVLIQLWGLVRRRPCSP